MSQRVIQLVCPGCGAKVASNESDLVLCHDEPVLIRCYKTSVEHGFRDMFSQQKIKFMLQLLMCNLAECREGVVTDVTSVTCIVALL